MRKISRVFVGFHQICRNLPLAGHFLHNQQNPLMLKGCIFPSYVYFMIHLPTRVRLLRWTQKIHDSISSLTLLAFVWWTNYTWAINSCDSPNIAVSALIGLNYWLHMAACPIFLHMCVFHQFWFSLCIETMWQQVAVT